jgi:RNA polymerase sigma-70 factor (ECF subfamily)
LAGLSDVDSTEAALVGLARLGDDAAFEALVRKRQASVRGLLRRLSGDAALGDDLAQDVFVLAWRRLGRLREAGAFGGWLRQIAINVWLQHLRRARPSEEPLDAPDLLPAAATNPGVRLDIDAALARLRPPERLCVLLAYVEGMSHGEIALATGLPLGTIKSHVSRGAARLRRSLGDEVGLAR